MTAKSKEIIVSVKFNDEVIKAVQEAPDFHEFCRKFDCKDCSFSGMEDCEYAFDSIKESEKRKCF